MNTFSRKNTMAAVILAAATVGLPTMAQAGNASSAAYRYEECKKKDTENQVLAGLAGAVIGGVTGSQVAGSGARSEGSALGAAIGAAAGVAIADKDCKERAGYRSNYYPTSNTYRNNNYYGGNTYRTHGTYGHSSHHPVTRTPGRAYGNRHVHNNRGYTPYQRSNHVCRNNESRLEHIKWEIRELREERKYLERERRYSRYDRRIDRRLRKIGYKIAELKREKQWIKDRRHDRDYYRDRDRDRYYSYY